MTVPIKDSLVLFKNLPARVVVDGEKLEIVTQDGKDLKVRPKDVLLLHPGPMRGFNELVDCQGEIASAWELLAGQETNLAELAELAFNAFTPATAWAAWQWVQEGLYFEGTPEALNAHSVEHVERERQARVAKAQEHQDWSRFLERIQRYKMQPEDAERLASVAGLARGRAKTSRVLKELGRAVTPEAAHAFLLKLGFWDETENPHPPRYDIPEHNPELEVPALPEEGRLDLTHLAAFAIDDEGNRDPDDAISLDGERIWVHVADVAALVPPDSALDLEARGRGANSYLPERTTTMLPHGVTELLGLGLQAVSPALSFGLQLDESGELVGEPEIAITWVKVTRLTYAEAENRLEEEPFRTMAAKIAAYHARRLRLGAAGLDLPEVKIKVEHGEVEIRPLARLRSREMVTDAMLMAGEAAALFAQRHELPIPFATQDPPDVQRAPEDLAAMFAYRKQFKRTRMTTVPGPHAGLGLPVYARATSPLRRYLDLVVHQQLRAFIAGATALDAEAVLARVGAAETVSGQVRNAERAANKHWTLVYLLRHPEWQGSGVLVEKRKGKGVIIVAELGLETVVTIDDDTPLNTAVPLHRPRIDLPNLSVGFQVQGLDCQDEEAGA